MPSAKPSGTATSVSTPCSPSSSQRDLAPREAQHAQRGQLVAALGQRDARAVVDDAEGDDAGEKHVDDADGAHAAIEDLVEAPQHRIAERDAAHRRGAA